MDWSDCNQAPGGQLTLLLGAPPASPEDNAVLIRQAFEDAGWRVRELLLDSLRLGPEGPLAADDAGTLFPLLEADLLWVLGFGRRAAFLDKHQLLQSVEGRVPYVSRPSALQLYHSKYPFPGRPLPLSPSGKLGQRGPCLAPCPGRGPGRPLGLKAPCRQLWRRGQFLGERRCGPPGGPR